MVKGITMTDKSKEYIKKLDERRGSRTPEQNSMANKLAAIVNLISDKMTPEERGDIFNGRFNTTDELVDMYLDFIRLTLTYVLFDNEVLKRENAQLHSLLEDEDGCDLAS